MAGASWYAEKAKLVPSSKDVNILLRVQPKNLPVPDVGWDALLTKIVEKDIKEIEHTLRLFGFDVTSVHISIKEGPNA